MKPRAIRLRVSLAVVFLVVLLVPTAASPAVPGVNQTSAYGIGSLRAEYLAELEPFDLGLMGEAGLRTYRARFRQDQVVDAGGGYTQWGRLDNLARLASLQGVTLLPVLINLPGDLAYVPPRDPASREAFASFAAAAARRYGTFGSFWPTCGCPYRPARVFEVWNEPNHGTFWPNANPGEYAALLQAVKPRVRRADPTARILFGGLATPAKPDATRLDPSAFLAAVINAAGRNAFDAVGVHNYSNYSRSPSVDVDTLLKAVGGVVSTLQANAGTGPGGRPRQQVWIGELGRYLTPDPDPAKQAASEQDQRAFAEMATDRLVANRSAWNLGPISWYAMRDAPVATQPYERLGLRRTNAEDTDAGPKPSWDAYTARSASAAPLPLPTLR